MPFRTDNANYSTERGMPSTRNVVFMKKSFCDRFREVRGSASQAEMARMLDTKQTTYSAWETGAREPNLTTLCAIATTFGKTTDWLLGLSETPRKEEPAINAPNNSGAIAIGGGNAVTRDCMECPLLKDHLKRFSKAIR